MPALTLAPGDWWWPVAVRVCALAQDDGSQPGGQRCAFRRLHCWLLAGMAGLAGMIE